MMAPVRWLYPVTATLLAVFCVPVQAGVTLELAAGEEYDSNVAVDVAETNAGLGDQARTLQLALGYKGQLSERWTLDSRYQLHDSRWQRYSAYDSQMHTGLLRAGYQQGRNSSDISLIHARASVAGQDFMQLNRFSQAQGRLLSRHWYLRLQGDLSQKTFTPYPRRDSEGYAVSLSLYRFIDRTRFYLSATVQVKQEHTDDPLYRYGAGLLRLQLRRDWSLLGLAFSSRLQGRVEHRQYPAYRSDIEGARADTRWRLGLDTRLDLSQRWSLTGSVQADRFDSNVPAAAYDQQRLRLALNWAF